MNTKSFKFYLFLLLFSGAMVHSMTLEEAFAHKEVIESLLLLDKASVSEESTEGSYRLKFQNKWSSKFKMDRSVAYVEDTGEERSIIESVNGKYTFGSVFDLGKGKSEVAKLRFMVIDNTCDEDAADVVRIIWKAGSETSRAFTFGQDSFVNENNAGEIFFKWCNGGSKTYSMGLKSCTIEKPRLAIIQDRYLVRQYNNDCLEIIDISGKKKLSEISSGLLSGEFIHVAGFANLPLVATVTHDEDISQTVKIYHIPTQQCIYSEYFGADSNIKELEVLNNELIILYEQGRKSILCKESVFNADLISSLESASNEQRKLYANAIALKTAKAIKEKIPNYKDVLATCPEVMKQKLEEVIIPEPSFWQRHKRRIIGGVGIAAGASVLYGLYSWYSSQ